MQHIIIHHDITVSLAFPQTWLVVTSNCSQLWVGILNNYTNINIQTKHPSEKKIQLIPLPFRRCCWQEPLWCCRDEQTVDPRPTMTSTSTFARIHCYRADLCCVGHCDLAKLTHRQSHIAIVYGLQSAKLVAKTRPAVQLNFATTTTSSVNVENYCYSKWHR